MSNPIYEVCTMVLDITEEDFEEMREIARGQLDFFSPLRNATMGWQRQLGEHNLKVLDALKHLQDVIKEGADIEPPRG